MNLAGFEIAYSVYMPARNDWQKERHQTTEGVYLVVDRCESNVMGPGFIRAELAFATALEQSRTEQQVRASLDRRWLP